MRAICIGALTSGIGAAIVMVFHIGASLGLVAGAIGGGFWGLWMLKRLGIGRRGLTVLDREEYRRGQIARRMALAAVILGFGVILVMIMGYATYMGRDTWGASRPA